MGAAVHDAAHEVLETVPLVMRTIRGEMRRHRAADLSVPQFRTLAYIHRHRGVSLSSVAEHIGLTLPSMSKLVDGLVARGLITRESCADDRRRVTLAITARGRTILQAARDAALSSLADRLESLSEPERITVVRAMQTLHRVFASAAEGATHGDS
jgi:DNA-binding MarR family transcriptional regulator